jgi:hypothetical protein
VASLKLDAAVEQADLSTTAIEPRPYVAVVPSLVRHTGIVEAAQSRLRPGLTAEIDMLAATRVRIRRQRRCSGLARQVLLKLQLSLITVVKAAALSQDLR